jgi:hypothetical protein
VEGGRAFLLDQHFHVTNRQVTGSIIKEQFQAMNPTKKYIITQIVLIASSFYDTSYYNHNY